VTTESLEDLARAAREGDRESLERLVLSIQDRIHGLAIRMLWSSDDARDATQEILIRIVTRLGTFRGASSFATWVYRVAANYLLTARKSRLEEQRYTFPRFGAELDEGLSDEGAPRGGADTALLLEEVKIGCTLGMLQCLDRPHRLAYVLGEILEMEGEEAARVLGIRPAAFRKRRSRGPGGDPPAGGRAKGGRRLPLASLVPGSRRDRRSHTKARWDRRWKAAVAWRYDGSRWERLAARGPEARNYTSMVHDEHLRPGAGEQGSSRSTLVSGGRTAADGTGGATPGAPRRSPRRACDARAPKDLQEGGDGGGCRPACRRNGPPRAV